MNLLRARKPSPRKPPHENRDAARGDTVTVRIPLHLERGGGRKLIIAPDDSVSTRPKPGRDETIIKALVRTHRWRRRIENGQAKWITDLAAQDGVADAYVCRLLPLTCLGPDIVEAILAGRQTKGLKAYSVKR